MFICSICGKPSERGESPETILLRIRETEYFNMKNLETTYGWEIVEEGRAARSHKHPLDAAYTVNNLFQYLPFKFPEGIELIRK